MRALQPCKFGFDFGPDYDGFELGSTWNGFDNVAVLPEVRDQIARDLEAEGGDDDIEAVADLRALPVGPDGLVYLSHGYATQILR